MISIPTLSFCTTCKNRFHQISRTLRKNLEDNRLHKDWVEFILVDFGSMDGLRDWVVNNFIDDLESGFLKYYYTEQLRNWHASIAKNTAHWCANNEIVVNLDCDNFTGYLGGQFVIKQFLNKTDIICHQFSGNIKDGSFGRIAVLQKYFDYLGGYNESFEPMGFQDVDMLKRLYKIGLEYHTLKNSKYCKAIANTKGESIRYTNSSITYPEMDRINGNMSIKNLNEGHLIANHGIYGIRKKLFDHKGQVKNDLY